MLSKKLEDALNKQINAELWSGYLYLSMAAYFAKEGLSGFASWFKLQAKEESDHALKIFDHIIARDGKVTLTPIEKVPTEWKSPLDVFEKTYEHEKVVTSMIHNLVSLAEKEKDYASRSFLQWYVDEQVEEEAVPKDFVDKLKFLGNDKMGVLFLDKELSERK